MVKWAKKEFAWSEIDDMKLFSVREHRKPFYKRDYYLLTITDPVAIRLEQKMDAFKALPDENKRSLLSRVEDPGEFNW